MFALAAFLGARLNQTRIFFIAVLWVLIYFLLSQGTQNFPIKIPLNSLSKSISVALPIIVILIFSIREGQLIGLISFTRLLFITISIGLCIAISIHPLPVTDKVLSANPVIKFTHTNLPDILWVSFLALILFLIMKPEKSITPFRIAMVISLIPMLIVLNSSATEDTISIQARIFNAISFIVMGFIFLHALYQLYWQKVYIDEMTGMANRRAFDEYLHKLGRKYAIAMVDIDYFKKFNDKYGHREGDNVLRYVSKHLIEQSGTHVFRYGGEEFAIVYKGVGIENIFWRLERMREKLANNDFHIRIEETIRRKESAEDRGKKQRKTKKVKVTISVGVAQRTSKIKNPNDVINHADKALYAAKNKGRNVCVKARIS